jgi:hypothetical protein
MMRYLNGSCLCRKVKIQVPDRFDYVGNCHCSECRKFSGSAFATAAGIDCNELKILQGEEFIRYYPKTEDTELGFCSHCGSSLFSKKLTTNKYNIRLGILDDAPSQKPTFHIFVGSKAPWYEISDDLKQFKEGPSSK